MTCPGDVCGQTRRCLEIIAQAIAEAGLGLDGVIRTRVMLTDIGRREEAARAPSHASRMSRSSRSEAQPCADQNRTSLAWSRTVWLSPGDVLFVGEIFGDGI